LCAGGSFKQTKMLRCNDRLVDPTKSTPPDKFYKDAIKQLDKLKWPLKFDFPKELETRIIVVNSNNEEAPATRRPEGHLALMTANYRTSDGIQRWTYYESIKYDNKTGREILMPKRKPIKSGMVLNKSEVELAFFLVFISGHCELIEGVEGQTQDKKKTYMVLDDKARKARKEAESRRNEFKVSQALYDPDVLSEDKLRVLAKSYAIDGVDSIESEDLDIVRNQIFAIVTRGSDAKAIEKFLDNINITEHVKVRALVQDAKDARVIFNKKTKHDQAWRWLGADNSEGDIIVGPFRLSEKPTKVLVDHLMANDDVAKALKVEFESR